MITILFMLGWFVTGCFCIRQECQKEKLQNQLDDYADWADSEINELLKQLAEVQRKADIAQGFGLV